MSFRKHGNTTIAAFRALRDIEAHEVLYTSYLGALELRSVRLRQKHLVRTKLFLCSCNACCEPDSFRRMPCPSCIPRDQRTCKVFDEALLRCTSWPEGYRNHAVVTPIDATANEWTCRRCQEKFNADDVFITPTDGSNLSVLSRDGLQSLADVEQVCEDAVDLIDERIADSSINENDAYIADLLEEVLPFLGTQHWTSVVLRDIELSQWLSLTNDGADPKSAHANVKRQGFLVRNEKDLAREIFQELIALQEWYDSVGAQSTWGIVSEAATAARLLGIPEELREAVMSVLRQNEVKAERDYGADNIAVVELQADIRALE